MRIPNELNVDGMHDPKHDITYIGKATQMEDGTWRCLANVEGALCLVEVNVKQKKEKTFNSLNFNCSFCGKCEPDCEVLIAGPTVNICNECVETAKDIVDDVLHNRKIEADSIGFIGHVKSDAPCETCRNCIPAPSPFASVAPWWDGVCTEGFKLNPTLQNCHLYFPAEHKINKLLGNKFVPPPGEFSGCRCEHCPEREGTGECKCCAERRSEEKNPGPDPIV